MKIVDEFTGRILEGRRWSEGLHQAVEAKEGVKIKEENQTLATVTLQNYFRMYEKLCGHDRHRGRPKPASSRTPTTSRSCRSRRTGRWSAPTTPTSSTRPRTPSSTPRSTTSASGTRRASRCSSARSRSRSRRSCRGCSRRRGIPHEVLNAKQHEREAEIVAQAGQLAAVTVATNMAGPRRRHPPRRQPRRPRPARVPEGGPRAPARPSTTRATPSCCPGSRTSARPRATRSATLGGLYVLGTERHESRRIDNQLRGRSGRQGDPGESRFYLSLEDELMRLFATGLMQRVMDASFPDDMPLESKMVSKAVERAQGTVEDRNFEIRKNVLKYDEVMNEQRKVIYRRRQQILDGEDLREDAIEAIESDDRPPRRPVLRRRVRRGLGRRRACSTTRAALLPDRVSPRSSSTSVIGARGARGDAPRRRHRAVRGEGSSRSAPRRSATSSAA